ncbi:cysteine-rich PDZ-binding protein-like [Oscarella lobularis]|uniref:cysteine-rich PDZ-binding protein-like n=1 Tax=Oscarella lobularis TaxID=121494 RepID=UPI003313E3BF
MVCQKCEKKLARLGAPDPWKSGSRGTIEGGRRVNENKVLTGKKTRFQPYQKFNQCRICKCHVHQPQAHYCQGCAYKKGICAMCGKQLLDVKDYRQSSV